MEITFTKKWCQSKKKKITSFILKVCYSENSNDIRSQYANRPSSLTAGILYTMTFWIYIITASNLCLLLQKEQNVKGGEGPSGKQAVGINNGTR